MSSPTPSNSASSSTNWSFSRGRRIRGGRWIGWGASPEAAISAHERHQVLHGGFRLLGLGAHLLYGAGGLFRSGGVSLGRLVHFGDRLIHLFDAVAFSLEAAAISSTRSPPLSL